MELYNKAVLQCSKVITNHYSTSFSLGIRLLNKKYRNAIYAIYGFVRFADEIVDTFYNYNQKDLLEKFKKDTYAAINNKISSNPILQSFQLAVNKYNIEKELIESFFFSMEMDLYKNIYTKEEYDRYIYGSAEVVGLMCLKVYYHDSPKEYDKLKFSARKLGRAFQQINFLRDIKQDYKMRGRIYFPGIKFENLTKIQKVKIENDIDKNLREALAGILSLKKEVRFGVFLAYLYFKKLFDKIKKIDPILILSTRIRINNIYKIYLIVKSFLILTFKRYEKNKSEKLNLKVEIDNRSGFCFGVVKAIKKAEEELENNETLYCVGEIVHNDEEVLRLTKKGLKIINQKDLLKLKNKKVLFRAHGEPPSSYKNIEINNNILIDASCPIIIKLQKRIKESYENGEKILLFGKARHPEIIGLQGQIDNQGIVFQKIEELNLDTLPKEITLYSQTTMDKDDLHKVTESLRKRGFNVRLHDTTCNQVFGRKKDIQEFAKSFDKVIFIAGKNSSNGNVLYNLCKKANNNTCFVSNLEMIKKEWFKNNERIGICGATSTPLWLMEEAKYYIESF